MCQLFIFINATFAFFLFSCVLGNRTVFFVCFLLFCGLFTGKWAALNTLLYVLWHTKMTKMTFDIQSNPGYFPSSLCLCLPAGWILLLHQIKYALYIHNNCHDMRKNVYERLCGNQMYIWLWFTVMTTINK